MGSSSGFSLDFNRSFAPMMMGRFLREISAIGDCRKRQSKLEEYVKCLEEERRKIDVFKRELPLCMFLLNDVIEALKNAEKQCRHYNESSRPVLEEFIPEKSKFDENGGVRMEKDTGDKMNWMSSAQLWSNSTSDHENNNSLVIKRNKSSVMKEKEKERHQILGENLLQGCDYSKGGGTFSPFEGLSSQKAEEMVAVAPVPDLSLVSPGIKIPNDESGGASSNLKSGSKDPSATDQSKSQPPRKVRRCWSPELHRQFVNALQQLGGSQVATPKQIRELMQVDGLTNDEVKSHLQKYRLHTRRLPASGPAVPSQPVVVVGGVWVPHNNFQTSKPISSQSGSPQSPLQLSGTAPAISTAGGDSCEDEEERSESYSWRSQLQKTVIKETK